MKGLLLVLLLFSAALADGVPLRTIDLSPIPMRQSKQVVFINWDGEEYTTDLYVTFGPSDEKFYWVLPFEEVPENVQLKKTDEYIEYENRIRDFRDNVFHSEESKFVMHDAIEKHGLVALANPIILVIVIPTFPFWGIIGLLAGGAPQTRSIDVGAKPIKTFEFGELGKAEVYDTSGTTMLKFFESKGFPVPESMEKYADKKIVVFELNKLEKQTSLLASFTFKSDGRIFYPSSTTHIWEGYEEQDFAVFIKTPQDYTVKSSEPIWPDGETHNHANTFVYYYGSDELFQKDIVLEMEPEEKSYKLTQLASHFVPLDWVTALLMMAVTWLSPYFILKKLKSNWKNFWRYCLYAFIVGVILWPFFNAIYLL